MRWRISGSSCETWSRGVKIAISGKSGCGNSTVTGMVAVRLGHRPVNYTFKNMAAERGIPFDELSRMAEDDPSLDRELDEEQVRMAREAGDAVLGSRLAVWILDDADLRVYLKATPEERARRIRERQGDDEPFEKVLSDMNERDRRDHERYRRLYGIDNDDYRFVDLVIDTTDLRAEEVVDRIVQAARKTASA